MGIQTLGLGSDTGLTMDTVDKLKAVDTSTIISPIEKKIETSKAKTEALSGVITLLKGFQSSAKTLSNDMLYLNRTGYVSAEGINVSIDKGAKVQTMSIEVTQLAEEEVIQSNTFKSRTDKVSSGDGTFEINVNGTKHSFEVTSSTTLEELVQKLNDDSNLDASAKIINTGNNEYRFVLSGSKTGIENKIIITESENLKTNLSSEENKIQEAKDSKFTYNGVGITRSSNSVADLVVGVTFGLTQITDNPIQIDVKEDVSSVILEMEKFVASYNKVVTTLDELTNFDESTNEAGAFQGNSDIRTIRREVNKILLSMDSENRSIVDFGMVINELGQMDFSTDDFVKKYDESSSNIQSFFQGKNVTSRGVTSHKDGLFYNLNSSLDRYVGSGSLLDNLNNSLTHQEERLNSEREKAVASLDKRYERMAKEFAQQDSIISQIEQQFKSIQMQIDMQNSK